MASKAPGEGETDQPTSEVSTSEAGPTFAAPEETIADLSSEILKALPRSRGEHVTCRRIIGNHYRCNWWTPQQTNEYDNPQMTGLAVTTHRVSKSQLLHVSKTADGLVIKPAARN